MLIETESAKQDPNQVKMQSQKQLSRECFLENQGLKSTGRVSAGMYSSFDAPKVINHKMEGDIFDALFERPKHRQQVLNLRLAC